MNEVVRCKACGSYVQDEDRFCWSCGVELSVPDAPAPAPVARPARDREPATSSDVQLSLRRAFLAQHRGEVVEAERIVREALQREPQSVPALSMLSEILRRKGDLVGAVDAAQRATEAAGATGVAAKGALQKAREERAKIEQSVLDELLHESPNRGWNPFDLFTVEGAVWHQSGRFYLGLAAAGIFCLLLALLSVLRGGTMGYLWFVISLGAAGWTYHDAESRKESGLFWGSFVLCLGPFGLAIYLLTRF
jgi:hypothetical protein